MANSADPDQLASSEANWSADPDQLASSEANRSGSALFAKSGYIQVLQDKGKEWYSGNLFLFLYMLWVLIRSPCVGYPNEHSKHVFLEK